MHDLSYLVRDQLQLGTMHTCDRTLVQQLSQIFVHFVIKTYMGCLGHSYRKRGKIRWIKLSQIPPNEVFHGKTFAVPYV